LQDAELGQALHPGDSVRTGKDSRAELGFGDGTTVRLGENSRFYIESADSSRIFKLSWGRFFAKVSKLTAKSTFQVETPTAVAGVRGTVFRVDIAEDSSSTVAVEEGEVEIFNPRRRERMVRLAAMRQAVMAGSTGPSESAFDTLKLRRWERWNGAMFRSLYSATRTLLKGLSQTLKNHERLRDQAEKALGEKARLRDQDKLWQQIQAIERKFAENRRKFRLMRSRLEQRLHQAQVLSGRMEDGSPQAQLETQARELRAELDAMVLKFEQADQKISDLLEQVPRRLGDLSPEQGLNSKDILAKMETLAAKADQLAPVLQKIVSDCDQIEPRLAEYIQKLLLIKSISADQPLLARQQFLNLRQEYLSFKASYGGFDFPALDKIRPESRVLVMESRKLVRSLNKSDPNITRARELSERITSVSNFLISVERRTYKVIRQAQVLERLILELESILKQ